MHKHENNKGGSALYNSVGNVLSIVFYALFAVAFSVIIASIVIFNDNKTFDVTLLLASMAVFLVLSFLLYITMSRRNGFFEKNFWLIVGIALGIMLIVNIVLGFVLRFEPIFDLGAIFTGASEFATTGTFADKVNSTCSPEYFYFFPNNLGGVSLLAIFFKLASFVGITDFYAVAMVVNGILAALTMLLAILIAKRIYGVKQSMLVMFFFLMTPPFYMVAPVFYTDSLSLVFPVLVIWLYIKMIDETVIVRKTVLGVLMGAACAVGMLVKFTVVIALIAVVIYHLLKKGIKTVWIPFATCVLMIIAIYAGFNAYMYSAQLDKEAATQLKTPYTHWIMMSLEGKGTYNHDDYEFTRSFSDPKERKTAIAQRIKERIKERGVSGMAELFYYKGITIFGDGTFAQSDFLDDNPKHDTNLHDYVLYSGKDYTSYKLVCSAVYFGILILALVSGIGALIKKQVREKCFVPQLCMFGIMLFLMMWEVSGRYATNFIPLIFISAAGGMDFLAELFRKKAVAKPS